MDWFKLFPPGILQENDFIRQVRAGGKKICIVKSGDRIFALQNKCPHAGADLSGGWCSGENIVCPYHRHGFNLVTGRGLPGQGDYIDIYPVEHRPDGVYVGIKKSWWKFW